MNKGLLPAVAGRMIVRVQILESEKFEQLRKSDDSGRIKQNGVGHYFCQIANNDLHHLHLN
jgi:hypothetical protein